jgi:hypothetical protein
LALSSQLLGRQKSGASRFKASPGKKIVRLLSQQISKAWWCIPMVPARWEAADEGNKVQAGPGQKLETLSKKKKKQKQKNLKSKKG